MKNKLKKGFSLVEMIIVISIIGVLMSISVPSVKKYQNKMEKQTFISQADSMYQKTIACLYSVYPSYTSFSEGIFISYPFYYDLSSETSMDDFFSISNFSYFLKYWYKQMEIDSSMIISEEYIKGSYNNSQFNNGNLKICLNNNLEYIFSMFLYVGRNKTQLYAEIDYIIIRNFKINYEKTYEM